jgi:PAS domain S-box-containing protein
VSFIQGPVASTAADPRSYHKTRFGVGVCVTALLGGSALISGHPASVGLAIVAAGSMAHAWRGAFGKGASIGLAFIYDVTAVLLGIAVLRPPPGTTVGLIAYGILAALVFTPRRTAIAIAVFYIGGSTVVLGVSHLVSPRTWDSQSSVLLLGIAAVVSTVAVVWVIRLAADGLDERTSLVRALSASEAAQRQAAGDLALVLDTTAEGIYGVSLDGVCTFVNRAVGEILGYTETDMVGKPIHDVLHRYRADGSAYPLEECSIALADIGDAYSTEEEWYVTADGSVIPVAMNLRRIRDGGGEIIGSVVSFRDITQQREAQQREHFQASLLDQVDSAVVMFGLDTKVQSWNRAASEIYGIEESEIVGRGVDEFIGQTSQANSLEGFQETIDSGSWKGEVIVRRPDGSTRDVLVSRVLLRDPTGAPTGILGVGFDVTEQRRAAEEARRQGDLARGVLESVFFPVCVIDRDGVIRTVNRAWTEFAEENGGSPTASGVGANYLAVARAAAKVDADAEAAASGLTAVLDGTLAGFDMEYPCHGPDEERWFRMAVAPLTGIGAVVTHWNTTVERRARAVLEDLVASKDRFVAMVSHEFRTPLTAVLGLAEELRDGDFGPAETDEFHRIIAEQARDLSNMVEDLLVAARVEADAIRVHVTEVDLRHEVDVALGSMPPEFAFSVEVDRASIEAKVVADDGRLRQVLRNLVANAFRHGAAPVRIVGRDVGGGFAIDVIDHGDGVPATLAVDLFSPYANAPQGEAASRHSIGLGLYVSRQLTRLMGGDLTYERRGQTTVFTVTLPVAGSLDNRTGLPEVVEAG